MSKHVTQFPIRNTLPSYMKEKYIKRKCGDLLYEALKDKAGKNHHAVRMDITFEEKECTKLYSVVIDVIDAPLMEATYGQNMEDGA